MAQLSDDCFAFGGDLLPLEKARALLLERVDCVVDNEAVPLSEAAGRVLAEALVGRRNVPPHDNSAVDGYAVRFADLDPSGPTRMPIAGSVAAGTPLNGAPPPGAAIRIFTGAPMPAGLDTVLMQEDCEASDDRVTIPPGIKRGANRRFAGEDVTAGDIILHGGQRLRPQDLGLAASVGVTDLPVRTRLRVALFSTGNELREPGTEAAPESARPTRARPARRRRGSSR